MLKNMNQGKTKWKYIKKPICKLVVTVIVCWTLLSLISCSLLQWSYFPLKFFKRELQQFSAEWGLIRICWKVSPPVPDSSLVSSGFKFLCPVCIGLCCPSEQLTDFSIALSGCYLGELNANTPLYSPFKLGPMRLMKLKILRSSYWPSELLPSLSEWEPMAGKQVIGFDWIPFFSFALVWHMVKVLMGQWPKRRELEWVGQERANSLATLVARVLGNNFFLR